MHINTHLRKIVPLKKMFPFDSNDRAIYTSILWYSLDDRSILTSVVLVYDCFTVNLRTQKFKTNFYTSCLFVQRSNCCCIKSIIIFSLKDTPKRRLNCSSQNSYSFTKDSHAIRCHILNFQQHQIIMVSPQSSSTLEVYLLTISKTFLSTQTPLTHLEG